MSSDNLSLTSPTVFLADCHVPLISRLGQEGWSDRVRSFLRDVVLQYRSLVIVGDLFDFWFEWRHSIPSAAFPILSALYDLTLHGIKVVYLGGNHDGHVGKFLSDTVGISVYREPIEIEIDSKRFFIIHGDGIAKADRGYRMLRRIVRLPLTENLYKFVHPDLGIWFAYKLSGTSREHFSDKNVYPPDAYRSFARAKLDSGFHYVVMGHRHEAEFIPHPNGGFLAVGDWIRSGSYGIYEAGNVRIEYFLSEK